MTDPFSTEGRHSAIYRSLDFLTFDILQLPIFRERHQHLDTKSSSHSQDRSQRASQVTARVQVREQEPVGLFLAVRPGPC